MCVEHDFYQGQAADDFGRELLLGAEKMRIILREPAHARHASQLAALLPAIHGAELRQAHRKVAIRLGRLRVDADVVRAVHWLQEEAVEQIFIRLHAVFRDGVLPGAGVDLLAQFARHSV